MKTDEPDSERLTRLLLFALLFASLNSLWLAPLGMLLCCHLRITWLESICNGFAFWGVGVIFLFGLSLFSVGTYGRLPWFSKHNNSTAATIIGICIMMFAFLLGHGGVAERNEAYLRGYDDGIHKRSPVDYRHSPALDGLIKFWKKKQQSNMSDDETH